MGSFEPQIIGKHGRRFSGFDKHFVARCARGVTVRAIQDYLLEMCGTEASPEFISKVTDEVMDLVDGLKNLAAAIEVALPTTTAHICIEHLLHNCLDYATWKGRTVVAAALRPV